MSSYSERVLTEGMNSRLPGTLLLATALAAGGCTSAVGEFLFPEAEAAGINGALLRTAYLEADHIPNMKSLLVWRHGQIVAEHYYHGTEVDDTHDVRSVTKTVLSMLVGIAAERGFIGGVDDTLGEHLGPVAGKLDTAVESTTLRHLLTMTAGHEWRELGGPSEFRLWVSSPNQVRYIVEKSLVDPPGTRFCYSDGSAHLVSVALSEATGMSTKEFAQQALFEPLGINRRPWLTDRQGYNYGGVGLQLTPREMVKLGALYLRHGSYEGKQVVPAHWVEVSTRALVSTDEALPLGSSYGYFWWVGRSGGRDLHFANGYGGQFIINVPDLDLVVVATSRWRNLRGTAELQWSVILDLVLRGVIPAVKPQAGGEPTTPGRPES